MRRCVAILVLVLGLALPAPAAADPVRVTGGYFISDLGQFFAFVGDSFSIEWAYRSRDLLPERADHQAAELYLALQPGVRSRGPGEPELYDHGRHQPGYGARDGGRRRLWERGSAGHAAVRRHARPVPLGTRGLGPDNRFLWRADHRHRGATKHPRRFAVPVHRVPAGIRGRQSSVLGGPVQARGRPSCRSRPD